MSIISCIILRENPRGSAAGVPVEALVRHITLCKPLNFAQPVFCCFFFIQLAFREVKRRKLMIKEEKKKE